MVLKVICAAVVMLPTWIAVLCVVAGILLLVPSLIVLLVMSYAGRIKESKAYPAKVR